jgi:colanic acid biosynthesis glycosyl transferase WcaI
VKIGLITQWFRPEPAFVPSNLADELAARGHEVRVLTGFPNYPAGVLYAGYRQRWHHEERAGDGVRVRRVPLYANHDASGIRRAANFLSFAGSSTLAAVRYLAGVDVVYVYLTPATVYAAGALLRHLRGVPTVIHLQDMWPESVTESSMAPSGLAGWATEQLLHGLMRSIYRSATRIAVIAPTMRDVVVARGADPAKVDVVYNWADETLFHPVGSTAGGRAELGHRGRCTILFAGTMGPFQNLPDSIRAAAGTEAVDLVFVGSGIEEDSAQKLTAELGATNVRFLGRRDPAQMAPLFGAADFSLVTLRDVPVFHGTMPSKLPTALACGRPVIVSVPGDCAALVRENGIGLTCPPEDPDALAGCFRTAAALSADDRARMAERARAFYAERLCRRVAVDHLETVFREAAAARPPARRRKVGAR